VCVLQALPRNGSNFFGGGYVFVAGLFTESFPGNGSTCHNIFELYDFVCLYFILAQGRICVCKRSTLSIIKSIAHSFVTIIGKE
jgi:hypothetical protein